MNDSIYITEEELEYFTNVPDMINEGNEAHYFSEEEYERDSQDCITLEEFGRRIDEAIDKLMPDP